MALRICLVTPFAWSQPHEVNEHVAGVARELRVLGHAVTIIASSNRAADLAAGRPRLNGSLDGGELLALGPAVPISRRSRVGVPVGVRANLVRALRAGRFDVVHGFEPALPSLSYLALREAESLAVATFFSPERLAYPPGPRAARTAARQARHPARDLARRRRPRRRCASPATTGSSRKASTRRCSSPRTSSA